jgi:hypothetical protein
VLADANPPQITAMLPVAESHYKFGDLSRNKYRAQVTVVDAESGVAHVTFVIDGKSTDVKFGDAGSLTNANGYTFFTDVDVTAKNVDTRIHITATAYDYDGNHAAQTADVIYDSVNDGTAPLVWWLTPLDGAAVVKGNVTLTLRIRATDDIHVDSVTFDSPLFASVTADRLANDIFEKQVTFDTPADGSPFTISATASDSGHQTVVPITIDPIVVDQDLATDSQINNTNLATFAGKSVRIHGSGKKLYISVPVTLKNLIAADGAIAGNPDGTKVDLTVRDHLYIDGDSSIDLTGKGFLGGWASHESGGQNASSNGVTLGNTTIGGALTNGTDVRAGERGPSRFERSMLCLQARMSWFESSELLFESREVRLGVRSPHFGSPELGPGTPEFQFGSRELRFAVPEIHFGTLELRFGVGELRFGSRDLRLGTPEFRLGARELRFGIPELRFETPEIRFGPREFRFQCPVSA